MAKRTQMTRLADLLTKIKKRHPVLAKRMVEASAVSRWDQSVGPAIARHARALRVQDETLWVEVDHPIWRSELHHRKCQILDLLNAGLSATEPPIKDIFFVEPRGPRTSARPGFK